MKCLRKYKWLKLHRACLPAGRGIMGYWAKLASKAAFRKGYGVYCGFRNPVEPGMWAGDIVGLKSILGVTRLTGITEMRFLFWLQQFSSGNMDLF